MIQRLCKPSKNNSFFLFGARGTGKSTLIRRTDFLKGGYYIDLLDPEVEEAYSLRPQLLFEQAQKLTPGSWIIIDEVQKNAKILDVVHSLIESTSLRFALTGSSSRKLKRGGANLLAGRAFVYNLFPFTSSELGKQFDLMEALTWGTLPKISEFKESSDRRRFLQSYVQTYVREEIVVEQLVRNLQPFRLFLPLAAQMNAEPINYSNIAKDSGADVKTVQNYFQILTETNLGFFLEPYHASVRKVQRQSPKYYFFDCGVRRALEGKLRVELLPQTSDFGNCFETFILNEIHRLNIYQEKDYRLSYLRTKDDMEVDLIIEQPGGKVVLVEIKSSERIDERHVKSLLHFKKDFPKAALICASRVAVPQSIEGVDVLPWQTALRELDLIP